MFHTPWSLSPIILSNKGMSYVLKKNEGTWRPMKKIGYMKVQANIKRLAMPKIVRMERLKHGASWSSLFTPSTTYPHTCTSRSWLYDLLTLWVRSLTLQNIWDKYALVFLPTLSSTKKPLEVGERRRTKSLGEDTNTFERMRVSFEELVFIFENFWKSPDVILSKEWVSGALWNVRSLNHPRQGEGQNAPWRLR